LTRPDPFFSAAPITFTYFNNGLRKTMADPSGTTSYTYDTRNRLTQKQTPEGTLNYTYDNAGNLLTLKSANVSGASDTYTYDVLNRLNTVVDSSGTTTYTYDQLNRLTQMGSAKGSALASYAYTLGAAGNRTSVAELSGRTVNYGYDSLYRLTQEAVTADPNGKNGTVAYAYDNVGNRQQMASTLNAVPAGVFFYNNNDQLATDTYDANGNTTSSAGIQSAYDFENHMVRKGAVTIVYDGDGNRVAETVAGATTKYLVDTQNPTGYAQVVDELQSGAVVRTYSFGLERISEKQSAGTSFYGYDGHGSVRFLMNSAGAVTDSYDYDAFGNLINQTGSTPNNYLFAGEQYDPALALYYNRARYLNTNTGRFWSMDNYEGDSEAPLSLHKYLYGSGNPVNRVDPTGHMDSIATLR
jgi:RHS repeat-associated protein